MLKFYNIKSGETKKCYEEPMISAYWASSDRSPNAHQGQDMGWRLAPEIVVELERINSDPVAKGQIATVYQILPDLLTETDILKYISDNNSEDHGKLKQNTQDFEQEYQDQIQKLRGGQTTQVVEETPVEEPEEDPVPMNYHPPVAPTPAPIPVVEEPKEEPKEEEVEAVVEETPVEEPSEEVVEEPPKLDKAPVRPKNNSKK